ncbi:MAG: hypothetical protein WC989_07765 [Micavibrio sp.]
MNIFYPLKWLSQALSKSFNAPLYNAPPKDEARKQPTFREGYGDLYRKLAGEAETRKRRPGGNIGNPSP